MNPLDGKIVHIDYLRTQKLVDELEELGSRFIEKAEEIIEVNKKLKEKLDERSI